MLIDCQENGIGDVVLACWIVRSARAAGHTMHLNPRNASAIPPLLSIDRDLVTNATGPNWAQTASLGLQYEYRKFTRAGATRFNLWCESLGLPELAAIRPSYAERDSDGAWADEQWRIVDPSCVRPRVAIFPSSAWRIRMWPLAYYIDLGHNLLEDGCAVVALGAREADVRWAPSHWWWGFSLEKVAALVSRAHLVIAGDTGPAHLSGTVGTRTLAICGPTRGEVVFGHDRNVTPVALSRETLGCTGCHFSPTFGYREACRAGGCQALMRLAPHEVTAIAKDVLIDAASRRIA